ncbi:MAG: energy-coupled thiamine transporter ThiT [Lachnospiraceae bacterium]|nr:energy-coupled thiamine transporter ThiT [Lachnospiraceae bacterium]
MFVTPDGGLTTAGYAAFIIAGIAAVIIGSVLAGKFTNKKRFTPKQLAFCGMGIALAFVTSYIQLFKLPFGGAVTLMSMLFIVLIANWYGAGTGILVGLAYGILQFIQEPYFLTFFQVCCDYLLAFGALGIAGFFANRKNGLTIGYIAGVIGRGVFASMAGYFYWMSYMPESFPKSLAPVYPIVYNFMYLGLEAVLTLIVINIPAMKNALAQVRRLAVG